MGKIIDTEIFTVRNKYTGELISVGMEYLTKEVAEQFIQKRPHLQDAIVCIEKRRKYTTDSGRFFREDIKIIPAQ